MALWGCVVTSGSGKFLNSFHIEDTTFVSECIVDFSSQLCLTGIQNERHLSNKMLSVHIILLLNANKYWILRCGQNIPKYQLWNLIYISHSKSNLHFKMWDLFEYIFQCLWQQWQMAMYSTFTVTVLFIHKIMLLQNESLFLINLMC